MIIVSYEYDNMELLSYRRVGRVDDKGKEIILPRQDEFVDVFDTVYRVETITHRLSQDEWRQSEQHIIIKLTKRLTIRSI